MNTDALPVGTVVENHGALFDVLIDGRVVKCSLRGRLKPARPGKDKRRQVAPIAAGDRVEVALLDDGRGVIERVLPRESDLSRRAAGSEPLQHTLVANVDQAVIVFAVAEPRCDFYMLDRFLVAAVAGGLERIICFNKCDLVPPEQRDAQFGLYAGIGFHVLCTSAHSGEGVEALREAMQDRRSVICGPSGVGKSSLLNAIAPGLRLRIGDVGDVTHKGRHTTSSITLVELPCGGWVADTPGLRQLGFWEAEQEHIAAAFPELQPHLGRCHFSNCSHRDDPGCALSAAVEAGEISVRRVKSYVQIMGGAR